MNPYERMLKSAPRMGMNAYSAPNGAAPTSSSGSSSSRPPSSSSAKRLPPQKKVKPAISFQVRPRFRFDLPDPPMDPKMLLGRLSTASYAHPHVSDLERDFRFAAVPSDPTHALHANLLVDASRPRKPDKRANNSRASTNPPPPDLSVDDEVLLRSLLWGPGTSTAPSTVSGKHGQEGRRNSSTSGGPGGSAGSGAAGTTSRPTGSGNAQINDVGAPWMRRMSYDEYLLGTSNVTRVAVAPVKERSIQPKRQGMEDNPAARERQRAALLQTFKDAKRPPVHPDARRANLKPVRVSPILPDFEWLGATLIALEFENEEKLTTEERAKGGNKKNVEESVFSMATISLADNQAPRKPNEPPKKFLACYTPTDETLRKRKRNDGGDSADEVDEDDDDDRNDGVKKIKFSEKEQYEWFGEYAIREGKFGDGARDGRMARSCFALSEKISEDGRSSVACLSKIGTSWMLAKRPFVEGTQRLGKEGLKLTRNMNAAPVRTSVRKALINGQQPQ